MATDGALVTGGQRRRRKVLRAGTTTLYVLTGLLVGGLPIGLMPR